MSIDYLKQEAVDFFIKNAWLLKEKVWTKFVAESLTITFRISLKLKLSGLYSNLFVIIFSLILQKKLVVGGGTEKSLVFAQKLHRSRILIQKTFNPKGKITQQEAVGAILVKAELSFIFFCTNQLTIIRI